MLALVLMPIAQGPAPTVASAQPLGDDWFYESGTIFLDPDIITPDDPSTFVDAPYAGQGVRNMFDRRVAAFDDYSVYLFDASFDDGLTVEIQVNAEFGSPEAAEAGALKYGFVIGQLPRALRDDIQTVWIHLGDFAYGGGNNNILIHTGRTPQYEDPGILEETLVHEASHTSLDEDHADSAGWLAAQAADGIFISQYAHDNPDREDVAESFLPWLALRHRLDRIPADMAQEFLDNIPNRIAYFDAQPFDLYPVVQPPDLQAGDDLAVVEMDTPTAIDVLANDASSAGNPMTITAVGAPSNGTAELDGALVVYTPDLSFLGSDTFTYTVSTAEESATATVSVTVVEEISNLYLPLVKR